MWGVVGQTLRDGREPSKAAQVLGPTQNERGIDVGCDVPRGYCANSEHGVAADAVVREGNVGGWVGA
jgi:hypothetical protein